MYGNRDFSQRPPPPYNRQWPPRIEQIRPNFNYVPNYDNQMQQNFYYPPSTNTASTHMSYNNFNPLSNNTDEEESALIASVEMRENDEKMIENYLNENEEDITKKDKKNKSDKESRISEARGALISVWKLNNELEEISKELEKNRDAPEAEWCEKLAVAQRKRAEVHEALEKLEDENYMSKVKMSIEKRKKKRLREKKRKVFRQGEKQAAEERRIKLQAQADAWIKDKQDVIEKEKQELSMRKDADIVLAEVRGRRNDARKYLALLNELQNLRRIQVNIARARGEHLSAAADEAFTNIIDKLVEQWTAMDREYSIEEQGLKLMLKTDNEQKIEKQKRNIFDDWENALFGRKLPSLDSFQRNVHAFVTMRAAWDKYISCNGLGSPIPIGWVMPDPPSSAAWQKYLKKE